MFSRTKCLVKGKFPKIFHDKTNQILVFKTFIESLFKILVNCIIFPQTFSKTSDKRKSEKKISRTFPMIFCKRVIRIFSNKNRCNVKKLKNCSQNFFIMIFSKRDNFKKKKIKYYIWEIQIFFFGNVF